MMFFFGSRVDERFLTHRLWSTSIAGTAGGIVAMGLFVYHSYVDHVWNMELLAVGVTMAVVKVSLMAWFHFTR